MADEFSAFAAMPAPKFTELDATELVRAAVSSAQGVASPDIEVALEEPTPPQVRLLADERMLGQALTNVLKNAAEAVTAKARGPKGAAKGRNGAKLGGCIHVRLVSDEAGVAFEVEDNGVGLPAKDRDRLTM